MDKTAILPNDSGMGPETWFRDRSRSARRYIREIDSGMGPLILLPLSKALLSMGSLPMSLGMGPVIWLLRMSRCIRLFRLDIDGGRLPEIELSAMFNTVRRWSFPMV